MTECLCVLCNRYRYLFALSSNLHPHSFSAARVAWKVLYNQSSITLQYTVRSKELWMAFQKSFKPPALYCELETWAEKRQKSYLGVQISPPHDDIKQSLYFRLCLCEHHFYILCLFLMHVGWFCTLEERKFSFGVFPKHQCRGGPDVFVLCC